MQSLLTSPMQPALPHALPFRVLFEEHLQRRRTALLQHIAEMPGAPAATAGEDALMGFLLATIVTQEKAYAELQVVDARLATAQGDEKALDKCLKDCEAADAPLKGLLHRMDSTALCLSGGGIRSASFSLGVLEGLADFSYGTDGTGLLYGLDYLSTVSGGGYIGSWLMAWVYRRKMMAATWKQAYTDVVCALAGKAEVTGGDPEPQPVRHLRSYTSFLAPALGLTLDTFTLGAIVARNLLANWLMLIPGLIGLIVLVRCFGGLMIESDPSLPVHLRDATFFLVLFPNATVWLILVLFAIAAFAASTGLPSHTRLRAPGMSGNVPARLFLLSVVLGSWLLTVWLPFQPVGEATLTHYIVITKIAAVGFFCLSVSVWLAFRARLWQQLAGKGGGKDERPWCVGSLLLILVAGAIASAATGALVQLLSSKIFPALAEVRMPPHWLRGDPPVDGLFLLFALPLTLMVLMGSTSLFCALVGVFEVEEDREWWARGGGWLLSFTLFWIVAHAVAFYGANGWATVWGLAIGALSSLAGYSGVTSAGPRPVKSAQIGKVGTFLAKHHLVLPVVGGVAVLLIAMGAAAGEEALRLKVLPLVGCTYGVSRTFAILLVSAVLTVLINLAININLFSLGGMYRLRLMRAYLGASNVLRHADAFTNFDPADTPYEADLPKGEGAPLHIVNTTLNLVGTKNLAWRQRKGESFTFNPVVAGGWRVGYVPTADYGGERGVTLATAMAISGAAANPNMGYHSSPLLSLLMTFFNLRLGDWLPNPKEAGTGDAAKRFLKKTGPTFALHPLVEEALGQTNDDNRWIELTDGGHFENLGLYEMVLRRAKHVIVVDAGADPECQFEDLGNAIRKIRIDLGVPIVFGPEMKMKPGMVADNSYCAVATIYYKYVDKEQTNGTLIYLKASVTGCEPADIVQYAKTHPTFPHETTADQFFNESQFESYRHLGFHAVSAIKKMRTGNDRSMAGFYAAARAYWASRPPVTVLPDAAPVKGVVDLKASAEMADLPSDKL